MLLLIICWLLELWLFSAKFWFKTSCWPLSVWGSVKISKMIWWLFRTGFYTFNVRRTKLFEEVKWLSIASVDSSMTKFFLLLSSVRYLIRCVSPFAQDSFASTGIAQLMFSMDFFKMKTCSVRVFISMFCWYSWSSKFAISNALILWFCWCGDIRSEGLFSRFCNVRKITVWNRGLVCGLGLVLGWWVFCEFN